MNSNSQAEQTRLIDRLKHRIHKVETQQRVAADNVVAGSCDAIDRLLPAGGYQRGSLVQWVTAGGQGADYLALRTAANACRDGGALVVIDRLNQFYPPTAAALGIPLDNLIILRNQPAQGSERLEENDFLWSIDQALRCSAVAAVWGPMDIIDARWFRRFQLSAEASGCLGLFIQPIEAARVPTWADVQWLVQGANASSRSAFQIARNEQPVRLQLARCRGTFAGQTIQVTINTVTGDVRPARRNHDQAAQPAIAASTNLQPAESAHRVPVVSQLGDSTTSRQPA